MKRSSGRLFLITNMTMVQDSIQCNTLFVDDHYKNMKNTFEMIKATEDAMKLLKIILIAAEAELNEGLRLLPTSSGQFVLTIDKELTGDKVIEYDGFKVLLVGIEYLNTINGKTIDCDYSKKESILFIR